MYKNKRLDSAEQKFQTGVFTDAFKLENEGYPLR